MKVTYVHSSRVIRVVGERSITNNKWSRFNEAFPVPENCDEQKINGRFQNGLLTITLPKITITPIAIIAKQTNDDESRKLAKTEQKKAVSPIQEEEYAKEINEKKKTTDDEQQEENSKKRKDQSSTLGPIPNQSEESSKKLRKEEEEKAAIRTNSQKQKEKSSEDKQAKEDLFGEKVKKMAAAAKNKVMKGFATETSEERQSLVNIGVAILVIAALGAYVSYSYRYGSSSGGDSKD